MMVKGKAVEVEVIVAVAVAVGGRKLWLATCRRENLIAQVIATAIMATVATAVILALLVMVGDLVMVSPQL